MWHSCSFDSDAIEMKQFENKCLFIIFIFWSGTLQCTTQKLQAVLKEQKLTLHFASGLHIQLTLLSNCIVDNSTFPFQADCLQGTQSVSPNVKTPNLQKKTGYPELLLGSPLTSWTASWTGWLFNFSEKIFLSQALGMIAIMLYSKKCCCWYQSYSSAKSSFAFECLLDSLQTICLDPFMIFAPCAQSICLDCRNNRNSRSSRSSIDKEISCDDSVRIWYNSNAWLCKSSHTSTRICLTVERMIYDLAEGKTKWISSEYAIYKGKGLPAMVFLLTEIRRKATAFWKIDAVSICCPNFHHIAAAHILQTPA